MIERIEKSWGYEQILHNGEYCCKKLVYTKHIASSLHYHENKHETFVVGEGSFLIEWVRHGTDAEAHVKCSRLFVPGDFLVLAPGMVHRVRCMEIGFLVEASTHDDPLDCVRLEPSES